jgi:hypothetical protein
MPAYDSETSKQAYKYLMASIKGRAVPSACVYHIIAWVHVAADIDSRCSPAKTSLAFNELSTKVYEWLLKWLTMSRTQAEFDAFAALGCCCTMAQCSDTNHRRGVREHSEGPFSSDKPCWYLFSLCIRATEVYLTQQDPCANLVRMNKIRHRTAWPFSIRGLLPYGPKETLDGILQWFHFNLPPRYRMRLYWSLELLVSFCQPAIVPYLAASDVFIQLGVIETVKRIEEVVVVANKAKDNISICGAAVECLTAWSVCMSQLMDHANESEIWIFHHANPKALMEAYGRAANVCHATNAIKLEVGKKERIHWSNAINQNHLSQISETLARLGQMLIVDCGKLALPDPPIALHPMFKHLYEALAIPAMHHRGLFGRLFGILDSLEKAQRCSAPDCSILISRRPLKLCTGCGLIRYCSRRCQKHAWRHHTLAHHVVCEELAQLFEMDLPKVNITAGLEKRDVMHDSSWPIDGPAAKAIFHHFRALTIYKMDALGADVHPLTWSCFLICILGLLAGRTLPQV